MAYKKNPLPFDKEGGVTAIQLRLLNHPGWITLTPQAKALMTLMQMHWRHDKPVAYGIREAIEKIPCAKGTARRAFKQLQEAGFIEMIDESLFDSRSNSKTRTWHLTWLPYHFKFPTNEWEKIKASVSNTHPVTAPQGQICTLKKSDNFHRVKNEPCEAEKEPFSKATGYISDTHLLSHPATPTVPALTTLKNSTRPTLAKARRAQL